MKNSELKRILKETIKEFHEKGLPKLIQRNIVCPEFKKINKIITIVGPRRAGKTYFLYQIMGGLLEKGKRLENILYINFENERISSIKQAQLYLIVETYKELYPEFTPLIFLDEIQNIKGWDKFVRRLQDEGYQIYVTGSNAKLLSKEISTALRGRSISVEVFPMSFKEFISFKEIKLDKNWEYGKIRFHVKKYFEKYLKLSGFPEIVIENQIEIIDEYFKTIFYRDILDRFKVKNTDLMRLLMKYIIRNHSQEFSIYKFNNFAKSNKYKSSTSVVQKYSKILEEVFFAFFVDAKYKSIKKQTAKSRKEYVIDQAFWNYYNIEQDKGRILENLIFIELKRRGKKIFYYGDGFECDFITEDEIIQVTYSLDENSKKRELRGLTEGLKRTKGKRGIILTYDQEDEIRINRRKITVMPVWKWLLK